METTRFGFMSKPISAGIHWDLQTQVDTENASSKPETVGANASQLGSTSRAVQNVNPGNWDTPLKKTRVLSSGTSGRTCQYWKH